MALPSAEKLAEMVKELRKREGDDRLIVMAQNPANYHHWTKQVIAIEAGDIANIFAIALSVADAMEEIQ